MSDFKVGDKVKCVRDDRASKLISGKIYTITSVVAGITPTGGSSVCVDGIRDDWWYADRFELIPQPADSPDDWVEITDPNHVPRVGVDWFEGPDRKRVLQAPHHVAYTVGYFANVSGGHKHYCRRRDYPQKPVEVHTGGPYVARSEYERVCVERDEGWAQAARIRDEAVKLAQARDKAIYDLNAVRATLEKRDAEVANLRHEQSVLLADLKDIEQTVIHLNKRVFADNPNGWPLVPVDPSCIPEGHRAAEVTCATAGKLVASSDGNTRHFNETHIVPRLVVEPIPTSPTPDALPRPEFPAWIRAGWWVAMDANGSWNMFENEPTDYDDDSSWYTTSGLTRSLNDVHTTDGMPINRWREAKWQIN
jgi:hypothetical protein